MKYLNTVEIGLVKQSNALGFLSLLIQVGLSNHQQKSGPSFYFISPVRPAFLNYLVTCILLCQLTLFHCIPIHCHYHTWVWVSCHCRAMHVSDGWSGQLLFEQEYTANLTEPTGQLNLVSVDFPMSKDFNRTWHTSRHFEFGHPQNNERYINSQKC